MDMVKVWALVFAAAGLAAGADFSIQVGNPSATTTTGLVKTKGSVMAIRAQGCADAGKATFTGTAVRMMQGKRESSPLAFAEGSPAGAFAVIGGWRASEGPWLAVIGGNCLGAKAGALVPINEEGSYVREASRFFNHAPTNVEIEAALKTIAGDLK